ncbi:synaptonemal complex protein 1-like [Mytilus edulis]|uniref:synaptonemal complex protein 1-like n=1 Tax=Mytilus edulis TaxID=6550 RepID=UPI0039EDFB24
MENTDSKTVANKLNTVAERKDRMVLKIDSICNWEQFVMPAPTSIAILGHLMAIATKTDFSLDKQIPEGGFKFVKYPGSFRACLVQISNSGCKAFMEAHKSMDKIRMYTMQFQESITYVVNILTKGSEEEKTKILPGMFEEVKNDADKCLHLAETTENKFYNVMLLIDETTESSAAVKGVYEDGLKEALDKMKILQMEEKQIEKRKQEMEDEKKRVIDELEKAKRAFDKSLDDVPGVSQLLLLQSVEEGIKIATGALNLFGQYQMMTISGFTAFTSLLKETVGETLKASNQSETAKDDQPKPELKVAYQYAYKMHVCIEKMYEMFKDTIDSNGTEEKKIDLEDNEEVLIRIKDELGKIKNDYKTSEYAEAPEVLDTTYTCEKGIELCDKMLRIKKKNADELFQEVQKLKNKSKKFQHKARVLFHYSPFSIPSTDEMLINQTSKSKRMTEIASENARYDVELRKKELDDSRRAREKCLDEVRKMDERQTDVLEELSKTKIESINFQEIQKTLKEGLIVLSQLKAQWNRLVLFFQNITSEIDVCLSQKTYKLDRRLRDGGYSVGHMTRDVVLEMATSVNCVAYCVELIATAYTEISKKHLVKNTASLVELIAYDPAKEGKLLKRRRQQIDKDCKEAKAEIRALAEKSRKDMESKIDSMMERLEEELNILPTLTPAKVQEIKDNVEKS